MTISIQKLFDGLQESLGESVSYKYLVIDAEPSPEGNDADLRTQILQQIPTSENNIKLSNLTIDKQINNTTWLITATYALDNKSFPNQSSMSFDTSGQTVHKTYDIFLLDSGVNQNGNFVQNPDIGNDGMPIGFNGEDIEGVDIIIPTFRITEVHPIPDSVMTSSYRRKLMELTGTVNNAPFRDYEAGEVLFLGVSGSKNGTEKWLMTFNFEVSLNKRDFMVGGWNIVLKRGWEYLDVRYKKQLSDDQTRIIVTPLQVDVHKVYETKDFSELGINTGTWEAVVEQNNEDLEQLLFPFGQ